MANILLTNGVHETVQPESLHKSSLKRRFSSWNFTGGTGNQCNDRKVSFADHVTRPRSLGGSTVDLCEISDKQLALNIRRVSLIYYKL